MKKIELLETMQSINYHVIRFVESELRSRSKFDLKYSHYEIIRLLLSKKSLSMKDISKYVMKHKSTTTALVKKLSDYGLVDTNKDRRDDRKQLVYITEHGKSLRGLINVIEQKVMLMFHKELTIQDQNNVLSYLNKMHNCFAL